MASALDRLSTPELEKLCVLAFWLGLGSDRAMSWGESRDEMKIFLSGVSDDDIAKFARFLREASTVHVSEEHAKRVAKLPAAIRTKASLVDPEAFARQPERQALAEVLSPEDSDLLLRWTTWSGVPPLPPEAPGVSR